MNRRPFSLNPDFRPGTFDGKLQLLVELKGAPSERAVPLLLELLCDQSWHVREGAVEALVGRGRQVIEPVVALLSEGLWYTRACAAEILGKLGETAGIDPLAARLNDENPSVRKAVAHALVEIAARKGAPTVKEALIRAGISIDRGRPGQPGGLDLELARALAGTPVRDSSRKSNRDPIRDSAHDSPRSTGDSPRDSTRDSGRK
jgi:hypothetical protein